MNLFVVAAQTRAGDGASQYQAVGVSLGLGLGMMIPVDLRYQVTRRISDDHAWAGFVDAKVAL